jgi:glycosyltransferase involved in cell wall biosynthesis
MTAAKPKLLFLAHLLPWPLEGGGQIKSYHTLRLLASHFDITLLAFVRQKTEHRDVIALQPLCVGGIQTVLLSHRRWRDLLAIVRSAISGTSLLIARDQSLAMASAVRTILSAHRFAAFHVDHLQMMPFVPPPNDPLLENTKVILDQHNVEHHLLRTIAEIEQGMPPLIKRVARWDLLRLHRFERSACQRADQILAVSQEDANAFAEMLGDASKISITPIGVDTDYFSPTSQAQETKTRPLLVPPGGRMASEVTPHRQGLSAPVLNSANPILSVGTMYWPPNVDAAQWFCTEILPLIHQRLPGTRFQIVGAKPTKSVKALADAQPELVTVTGTVPDVRPSMAACGVFVVPLRAGSGMRVKILNAMAMGIPIVSTTLGAEGIDITEGENILLADTPTHFSEAVLQILTDRSLADRLGQAARMLALEKYSWDIVGQRLLQAYQAMGLISADVGAESAL